MSLPFKIKIITESGDISFGRRVPGQIGKDIMAVKLALGVIKDANGILELEDHPANESNNITPQDDYGWFDCVTGNRLTQQQAATFDQKTEIALINYQTSNQFLILCYMFQKFGAARVIAQSDSDSPITQIEAMTREHTASINLFNSELGVIGESTLAIMHGWLPYSKVTNRGYYHDENKYDPQIVDYVYDIITPELREDFATGRLGQQPESLDPNPGLQLAIGNREDLGVFLNQVSEEQKWIPRSSTSAFGTVLYNINLPQNTDLSSPLFKAASTTIDIFNSREIETARGLTEEELARSSSNIYYPNPFTTKDPFYISETEEGFYLETDFVLSAEGPLPNRSEETISSLEDQALEKILEYYDKPKTWFLLKNDEFVKLKYFGAQTPPDTNHVGYHPQNLTIGEKQLIPYYRVLKMDIDFANEVIEHQFERWRVLEALDQRGPPDEDGNYDTSMLSDYEPDGWTIDGPPISQLEGQKQMLRRWDYWNTRLFEKTLLYNEPMTQENNRRYFYVLGSKQGQDRYTDEEGNIFVDSWRLVEGFGRTNPLIKFIEFKTPSFRPNQRYVAFFEINKEKLNLIVNGDNTEEQQQSLTSDPPESPSSPDIPGCASTSAEESKRLLEEQRVHARSKRRQIVRQIRERLSREEEFHRNSEVDLGTYGPFDLNAALGSLLGSAGSTMSDYEYSKLVLSTLGETGEMIINSIPGIKDVDYFNSMSSDFDSEISSLQAEKGTTKENKSSMLEIDLEELKLRIETAIKDLRDSESILSREGITYRKGSKFSADQEINFLNQFYTDLSDIVFKKIGSAPKGLTTSAAQKFEKSSQGQLAKAYESYSRENLDEVNLSIKFEISDTTKGSSQLGPLVGSQIKQIFVTYASPPPIKGRNLLPGFDVENEKSEALRRPRTAHYIRNIKEMTGLLTSRPNSIKPFLGDARGSCAELGVNFEKRQAASFIASYTTGVKANPSKNNPIEEAFTSIWKENFKQPAEAWWEQTKANARETVDTSNFDSATALRQFGELCTLEDLYVEFFSKLSLPSLFCDWLKCIRFPGFNLKLPSFYFPPLPSVPLVGWYSGMIKFFQDNWSSILKRLACTMAKILIDKLAMPFCQEQLEEFVAAGLSTTQPYLREAIIDSIRETGIATGKEEQAKQLFEDVSNISTSNEFCDLLEGKSLDDAAMLMIERLVEKNDLQQDLYSKDAITNYFGVIGSYLPFDLCQQIRVSAPANPPKNCIEFRTYLQDIRNRLTTGDSNLTDAEIEEVVDAAREENKKLEEDLRAFSGGNIGDSLPPAYEPGNPKAVISDFPDWMKDQMNRTITNCFSEAKSSYIRSLQSYVPTMSVPTPQIPRAGYDYYQDIEAMRLEAAVAQLSMYSSALQSQQRISAELREVYFGDSSFTPAQIREGADNFTETANLFLEAIEEHRVLFRALRADPDANLDDLRTTGTYNRELVREFNTNDPRVEPLGNWLESFSLVGATDDRQAVFVPAQTDGAAAFYRNLPHGEDRWTTRATFFRSILEKVTQLISSSTARSRPRLRTEVIFVDEQQEDGEVRQVAQNINYYNIDITTPFDLVREDSPEDEKEHDLEMLRYFLHSFESVAFDLEGATESSRIADLADELTNVMVTARKASLLWTSFEYEKITRTDQDGNERTHFVHKKYKVKPGLSEKESFAVVAPKIYTALNSRSAYARNHAEDFGYQTSQPVFELQHGPLAGQPISVDDLESEIRSINVQQRYPRPNDKYLYGVFPDATRPSEDFFETVTYDEYYESISDPENNDEFVLAAIPSAEIVNKILTDDQFDYIQSDNPVNSEAYYADQGPTMVFMDDDGDGVATPAIVPGATVFPGGIIPVVTSPRGPLPILFPEDGDILSSNDPEKLLYKNAITNTKLTAEEMLPQGREEATLREDARKFFLSIDNSEVPTNTYSLLKLVDRRVNHLTSTITEVFNRRPNLITSEHLQILNKIYKTQNFLRTENVTIENSEGEDAIQLSLGLGIYAPKIKIADIPANRRQDRFDVEITSDLHLRQIGDHDKKLFKLCDGLPLELVRHNDHHAEPYFSKREAFAKMVIRNSGEVATDLQVSEDYLKTEAFLEIRESILKYVFEELKKSELFDPEYAEDVNTRVAGRPDYSRGECVTNRYGLVDASILSFDKVILKNNYQEFMKEIAKPENSPFNRDFDDASPIEIAIQNMAFKAFVRVCLIDTMLKGGIAYSVWDIEPVISSTVFLEYAFEHTRIELNRNRPAMDLWKKIAERSMGIDNSLLALRSLVQEEIQSLADLSKQIFSPNEEDYDHFNWYIESAVPTVAISPVIGSPSASGQEFAEGMIVPYQEEGTVFSRARTGLEDRDGDGFPEFESVSTSGTISENAQLERDSFFIQEYVSISGLALHSRESKTALRELGTNASFININQGNRIEFALGPLGNEYNFEEEEVLILSDTQFQEFIIALKNSLDRTSYNEILHDSTFKYGRRLMLARPVLKVLSNNPEHQNLIEENIESFQLSSNKDATHYSIYRAASLDFDPNMKNYLLQIIPVLTCETDVGVENCPNIYFSQNPSDIGLITYEIRDYTYKCLKEDPEFLFLFENIFNIRRYLSIFSMFATSTLQGFNGMVGLLEGCKTSLGFLMKLASTPASEQFSSIPMGVQDFENLMANNFPVEPSDAGCFDVPVPDFAEFLEDFIKELGKLLEELPSVFFRGVASVIDPAYKEMKQHYYNCDIKELTNKGLDYSAEGVDSSLINGLLLRAQNHGEQNGKYVPLESSIIDITAGIATLDWSRIGKSILKIVTYAYSGQAPFLDPSGFFEVPCAPKLNTKWLDGEMYDAGKYGRYGQPTSPFTWFALATKQLQRDIDIKNTSCRIVNDEQLPTDECSE